MEDEDVLLHFQIVCFSFELLADELKLIEMPWSATADSILNDVLPIAGVSAEVPNLFPWPADREPRVGVEGELVDIVPYLGRNGQERRRHRRRG